MRSRFSLGQGLGKRGRGTWYASLHRSLRLHLSKGFYPTLPFLVLALLRRIGFPERDHPYLQQTTTLSQRPGVKGLLLSVRLRTRPTNHILFANFGIQGFQLRICSPIDEGPRRGKMHDCIKRNSVHLSIVMHRFRGHLIEPVSSETGNPLPTDIFSTPPASTKK